MTTYNELIMNEYTEKYATNWFKMNESSGTTLNDSKGSIIGTINGATWISDGGLSFDGVNDYILFNNKTIPIGEKTVQFEFHIPQKPSDYEFLLSSGYYQNNINGFYISITPSGTVDIAYSQGTNTLYYLNYDINSDNGYGKWHTLRFTFDGSKAKLFINDMNSPLKTADTNRIEPVASYNLYMGAMATLGNTTFFNGGMRNLIISNKDISKIKLSKTLILSKNEYKKWNEKADATYKSLVPILNSATNSSGIAINQSSYYVDVCMGWKAFDGILSDDSKWLAKSGYPQWISIDFPNENLVKKYSLCSADSTQNVSMWRLQGSNNGGINWVDIHVVSNNLLPVNTFADFYLTENNVKYKSYRLFVEGGSTRASISGMQLYEEDTSGPPAHWSTFSSTIPTSEQFLTEGMSSLSPLLDRRVETLEPLPMTEDSTQMESGKLFSKTINLKKYVDIRSVKVDVK